MNNIIHILDNETIDKIAAGEVVERPMSVIKELVENSIDAGSKAVTVEIEEGGIEFIRVTDNGSGILRTQIRPAFLRHATSKIETAEDLFHISSLGFRGEALSSIAAVSKTEVITKTEQELIGVHYRIEGGAERDLDDIGAPNGTTFLVRNLFYNTPARRKFLKSAITEGNYVADLMEHFALSHPEISFQFIMSKRTKFSTAGNGSLREVIYRIYGREIEQKLREIQADIYGMKISGFIGEPVINRSNRNYELFFVNGRFIKSDWLYKACETAFAGFLMQHKYPFCVMHLTIDTTKIDVNVHPNKMDIRFSEPSIIYDHVLNTIRKRLEQTELIPEVNLLNRREQVKEEKQEAKELATIMQNVPQPFETNRINNTKTQHILNIHDFLTDSKVEDTSVILQDKCKNDIESDQKDRITDTRQQELTLDIDFESQYEILGQVFDTYWIVAYKEKLLFIDQHAAHEKVKYEELVHKIFTDEVISQQLITPIIVKMTPLEEDTFSQYDESLRKLGFEAEPFGQDDYAIRSVPLDLYGFDAREMFLEILDELSEKPIQKLPETLLQKMASMACKAAVKGNSRLSQEEAKELIHKLLKLENPFNCPHGRPVIISMSKYEMEKKFKRIL